MEEKKEFYLLIRGEKVVVSEELYREYVRPVRNDQRKKRRNKRCRIVGKKGNLIRCQNDCSKCSYAKNGKPNGSTLSLDEFKDKGYEIENRELDVEADYIAEETRREQKEKLHKAIKQLNPRQQEIVRLIYFEGKTQKEVCEKFGLSKQAVSDVVKRIIFSLKRFLEEN